MIICASCGRENEDHYKFCLGCGGNLDAQREASSDAGTADESQFCPSCGAHVSPGQRFCGTCGFKVEAMAAATESGADEEPAPAPAPAPEPKPKPKPKAAPAKTAAQTKTKSKAVAKPSKGAAGSTGQLIMINPDGTSGDTFPLSSGVNEVGRDSEAEIFSRDSYLSPKHATFTVDGKKVHVKDEDSLNGVFYRIMEITELQHGDQVRVGQELLRFQLIELADTEIAAGADGTVVAGSSPAGAWGKLERISAPEQASLTFLLRGGEQVLGRERGDILFLDDGYVSGKHARIFMDSGRCFVEDLKSSNGTFIRIRGDRDLQSGSLILLGQQPFRIQLG